ncbi:MAG: secondary thiamine-phosphate synthase enzyme YjbQ [Candidatus Methanofastidiosia archaeon]
MKIQTKELVFKTKGEVEILNITENVNKKLYETEMESGIVTIFTMSSTSAITTLEYEPGLIQDLPKALERLFPRDIYYGHEEMWHDGNGHSHVRAAFLKPSLVVPFKNKRMMLGTWQQIVFCEFDNKRRSRRVVLQFLGE